MPELLSFDSPSDLNDVRNKLRDIKWRNVTIRYYYSIPLERDAPGYFWDEGYFREMTDGFLFESKRFGPSEYTERVIAGMCPINITTGGRINDPDVGKYARITITV